MIEVHHVVLSGRLAGVSANARPGELVALLGPNGAGKSTLLAVCAGLLTPTSGSVRLEGRPLGDWSALSLARRRAVVTQTSGTAFPLSAAQVVALGRLPHGDERRAQGIVARSLAAVGVLHLAEHSYPHLSGGEQQRVGVARALAQLDGVDRPILLLDEPTASADLGWQERLLALLRQRADNGATVVLVAHDLNLAARWSDRVVVLHHGRVVGEGPPSHVLIPNRLAGPWGVGFHHTHLAGYGVVIPNLESS